MEEGWPAVRAFVRRRREWLGLTQQQAADKAGLSLSTWNLIEVGPQASFRRLTLAAAERALGLEQGALNAVARGDPPAEEVTGPDAETADQDDPQFSLLSGAWADLSEEDRQVLADMAQRLRRRR